MYIQLHHAYSFCQRGRRDYQEDGRYPDCNEAPQSQRFFVVCDGVGGSEKGEVASKTVCEAMGKAMSGINYDVDFTNDDFLHVLDAAYNALDKAVNDDNRDMGTTMTFICFHSGGCTMAHIGDSRIYQIRPSVGILYRSDDHSLVNSLVHNGMVSPDEAEHHPQRNVITRYMESVESDQNRCMATVMRTTDVQAGDYFLLCTDGVLHQVTDDEIVNLLISNITDKDIVRTLAEKSQDSEDNNTAWLVSIASVISDDETDEEPLTEDTSSTKRLLLKTRQLDEIESVQPKLTVLRGWVNKFFKTIKQ